MKFCLLGLGLFLAGVPAWADSTYVRFNTSLGNIDVQMLSDPGEAPMNVANFMGYANNHLYDNSIIHRSVPGFVIQGGGYTEASGVISTIAAGSAVTGEGGISNVRGTLAMALSTGPNSGTDEWFFNLADNSAALDGTGDGGPFTVFARVTNASSLAVMDSIAAQPTYSAVNYFTSFYASNYAPWPSAAAFAAAFSDLPLINFTTTPLTASNFVNIFSVTPIAATDFSAWQTTKLSTLPADQQAPTATPEGDGVTNLMKYAFDVTPAQTMTATDRARLPATTQTMVSGAPVMVMTYRLRMNLVGVFVNVQSSSDLTTWAAPTNATTTQTTATDGTGDTIMKVQVSAPTTGFQFIRLSVSQ